MGISSGLNTTGYVPMGVVLPFAGASAPANWLLCDGSAVSRTTYGALYALIGTTYGAGDSSTTFNLPDLRGRVPAGKDDMGGSAASRLTSGTSGITATTLGASGGDQRLHTHQHANTVTNNAVTSGNNSVSHTHSGTSNDDYPDHSHRIPTEGGSGTYRMAGAGSAGYSPSVYSEGASARHTHSFTTGSQSANHTHSVTSNVTISNVDAGTGSSQNVQPTIVLNYIIKATNY